MPEGARRRRTGGVAHGAAALALLAAGTAVPARAQSAPVDDERAALPLHIGGLFVQGGWSQRAHAAAAGAAWRLEHGPWSWGGRLDWYVEALVGAWIADEAPQDGGPRRRSMQLGVTPVARWHFGGGAPGGFVEAGIGLDVIAPKYRSGGRRFSTHFNFGDHVGVGWSFGPKGCHEVLLRVQHVSNADVRQPNPGEEFVQLRYLRWF